MTSMAWWSDRMSHRAHISLRYNGNQWETIMKAMERRVTVHDSGISLAVRGKYVYPAALRYQPASFPLPA